MGVEDDGIVTGLHPNHAKLSGLPALIANKTNPAYVRQAGYEPIQQEQMTLDYIDMHGFIKRSELMELCQLTKDQAYKVLDRLSAQGKIERQGEGKGSIYKRKR